MSSDIKRRDFLLAALAASACGRSEPMPIRIPYGPNPLDPRQPFTLPPPTRGEIKTRPYTQQASASPVHLSASVVLSSGSAGTPSLAALKNPMGQDMELLEIKFEVSGEYVNIPGQAVTFGSTISAELVMGTIKLTNGSVPLWGFGRAENIEGETKSDSINQKSFSSYSWRLPRPLFIPAGAVVVPNFTHRGLYPNALNVRVGYSARTVFTKPKVVYVPWVAGYTSKAFNPRGDAGVDSSTELDLVNPHPEVLHLQRFTGRLVTTLNTTFTVERCPTLGVERLWVRMTDSYGRPIVRSYTPFGAVFQGATRSWEVDGAELDPDAYYIVQLRKDAEAAFAGSTSQAQAFVSMVGWRELENP